MVIAIGFVMCVAVAFSATWTYMGRLSRDFWEN